MTKESEKKYNRLMEKAEELFMKVGYKRISMDELAAAAGISKMTIYKHFSSKEALFTEVLIQMIERHFAVIAAETEKIPTSTEKIEYMLDYTIKNVENYSIHLYKDLMDLPYVMEAIIKYKGKKLEETWWAIIREGIEKGEMRPIDIEFAASFFNHLQYSLHNLIMKHEDKGIKWIVANLYDLIKYGILRK